MITIEAQAAIGSNISDIVRRSAFLWERQMGCDAPEGSLADPVVRQRLDRWNRRLSALNMPGDAAVRRRLAWEGRDLDSCAGILHDSCPSPFQGVPAWGRTIVAMQLAAEVSGGPIEDRDSKVPFRALYEPIRRLARDRLSTRLRPVRHAVEAAFDSACLDALDDALLTRLSSVGAAVLLEEFEAGIPVGDRIAARLPGATGDVGHSHYARFVSRALATGYGELFDRYPVLARLWATIVDFWVDASAELIERFVKDSCAIASRILDQADPTLRVKALSLSLSDAHRTGLSTAILTFDSGRKVVYKPKNLELDVAFNRVLEWCNGAGAPLGQHVTRVIDRCGYGWCEFVTHDPCADGESVRRFYRRTGGLMTLLHVLRGTDAHFENLIAHGEYPCLIDTETLLHPEPASMHAEPPGAQQSLQRTLADSVLRIGLLPRWEFSADRRYAFDIGGLADLSHDQTFGRAPAWQSINSDAMRIVLQDVTMSDAANGPLCPGVDWDPNTYRAEILGGFEDMYAFLRANLRALSASGGPFQSLEAAFVRYVFRPTRVYTAVLQHALVPQRLRSGTDFSIELERLSCGFLLGDQRPTSWSMLLAEQKSLGQLDVPYFHTSSDSLELVGDGGLRIERFFATSGWSDVQRQLDRMRPADSSDLRLQRLVIRASFDARLAHRTGVASSAVAASLCAPAPDWLEAATAVAKHLEVTAIELDDGSPEWLSLKYTHEADRFHVAAAGDSLYDGRLGIGTFLSALHHVTGSTEARRFAERLLAPLASRIDQSRLTDLEALGKLSGIGAASGSGGVVYGFTRIAGFLSDPVWIERARRVVHAMAAELIHSDESLDVIGGSAGALFGLIAFHSATGDRRASELARLCGDHLLGRQRADSGAWAVGGHRVLSGFAHGAAGISDALTRLAALSGDPRYLDGARRGQAFERTLHDSRQGNWYTDRDSQERHLRMRVQWCHGAPGIALSRLSALAVSDAASVVAEAVKTTIDAGPGDRDHTCCGTAGRIEAAWTAARAMGRPDWAEAALALAALTVGRSTVSGYRLSAEGGDAAFNPSFFQGSSGIGYQWLRLARPDLPSILAFH